MAVTAFAPAKVNLYLHITGRRDDGYHLLDSLVALVDIGDRVSAEPAASLSLTVDGPEAADLGDKSYRSVGQVVAARYQRLGEPDRIGRHPIKPSWCAERTLTSSKNRRGRQRPARVGEQYSRCRHFQRGLEPLADAAEPGGDRQSFLQM